MGDCLQTGKGVNRLHIQPTNRCKEMTLTTASEQRGFGRADLRKSGVQDGNKGGHTRALYKNYEQSYIYPIAAYTHIFI